MWFPSAPICVCACACVVISPNAVPGPLGQQPCLALRLWKASAQPKRSRRFMVTTLFLLHASCRLFFRGDAAPDKRLFSCFGAAVVPWGYSCCRGLWGEDAGRPGRAALARMLAAFYPLCSGLPTSARGNQRKRISTPQHAVPNTSRGVRGASIRSLRYVLLCRGGVWNIHPHSPFQRCFLPLRAASWLALSAGYFGSQHPAVASSSTVCRGSFGKARGALAKAEGLAVAAGGGELWRGDNDQPLGREDGGVLGWHTPDTVSWEARLLLQMLALHAVSRSQGNTSPCPYCSPRWTSLFETTWINVKIGQINARRFMMAKW